MTKEKIKSIVVAAIIKQYDKYYANYIYNMIYSKSNDGDDILIFKDLKFDSLDMVQFISNIKKELKRHDLELIIDTDTTIGNIVDFIYNFIQK